MFGSRIHIKFIIMVFLVIITMNSCSATVFSGYTYNMSGNTLADTNITVEIWDSDNDNYVIESYSNISDGNGSWNLYVPTDTLTNVSHRFLIFAKHNNSNGTVDYVTFRPGGQTYTNAVNDRDMDVNNLILYLHEAVTVNITMNLGGQAANFSYYVGDEISPLLHVWSSPLDTITPDEAWPNQTTIYLPADREHNIRVSEENGAPPINYYIDDFYNTTKYGYPRTLDLVFNCTNAQMRISGRINLSNGTGTGFDDIDVIFYEIEGDNLVLFDSPLPYNWSRHFGESDHYNFSEGTYNVSMESMPSESNLLMFVVARINNSYYGGFRNITASWAAGNINDFDFTLYGLLGNSANISTTQKDGSAINITVPKVRIQTINSSGDIITNADNPDVFINYSDLDNQFSITTWPTASQGIVSFPVLAHKIDEFIVHGGDYGSSKLEISLEEINQSSLVNVTVREWNMYDINGNIQTNVKLAVYRPSKECNVPNPPNSCVFADNTLKNLVDFNDFNLDYSGGKASIRIKKGNLVIHYKNADTLSNGVPMTDFDALASTTTSGNIIEDAWRLGSFGPKIYEEILIGIPYNQNNYNESGDFNVTIKKLYDSDWNLMWNVEVNGTTGLKGNLTDYVNFDDNWFTGKNCSKTNASKKCFVNTSSNQVWITIPHFSGLQPIVSGVYTPSENDDDNSPGGGSSGSFSAVGLIYIINELMFKQGYTKSLSSSDKVKVNISGKNHYITMDNITSNKVKINITSDLQQATLFIGDEKKFEVTDDSYYDIIVRLNNITNNKANLTIRYLHEKIISEFEEDEEFEKPLKQDEEEIIEDNFKETKSRMFGIRYYLSIIVVIIIILFILSLIGYKIYYKKIKKSKDKKRKIKK
ncbi:hypothetical protein GF386_02415 [Candidatus Pacearchaeota archaeon]|nr:hypothetical protein [Candidatus Pacearchaeota archaeon]